MAKQAKERDWSVEVTRAYGVVPRPRSSVCPEAWARTKRPGKWRAYYGYSYRPGVSNPEPGSQRDKYSDAQVAAAKIAHDERGGRVAAFEPSGDEKRAAFMAEAVASVTHERKARVKTPRPHGVNGVDYHVTVREPVAAALAPVCEPEPVPLPEPAPEPISAPAAPASDRLAIAAAVLRDLAAKYGPRRAHKLLAMADFVTAAAGIAA